MDTRPVPPLATRLASARPYAPLPGHPCTRRCPWQRHALRRLRLRAAARPSGQAVALERVKNRMHPPAPAGGEAAPGPAAGAGDNATGYRDVAINLRVLTERARELSLDWHVAEVQLLLLSFQEIKSDHGHARYVRWRNLRGE